MSQSYFIWNGVDCRSRGIRLRGPVPIVKPEERVQHVTIPGRDGELTLTEGEWIYESYIQTVSIQVTGAYHVREISKWLRGSGYVTFHGEPDRRQAARVIGAVTLEKHSKNLDVWEGECQFYCEPLKQKLLEESVNITSSGTKLRNTGDVIEKPLLQVTVTGDPVVIACGGKTLTITAGSSGATAYNIDCDAQIIWHGSGALVTVDTQLSSGNFPQLLPGENTLTGSGWSAVNVIRKERFL